jgi:hypothetical protein
LHADSRFHAGCRVAQDCELDLPTAARKLGIPSCFDFWAAAAMDRGNGAGSTRISGHLFAQHLARRHCEQ